MNQEHVKLQEFLNDLSRSNHIRVVDMKRFAHLWSALRGLQDPKPKTLNMMVRAALENPINVSIRNQRLAEDTREKRPPYTSTIAGYISKMISNPLTNGAWQGIEERGSAQIRVRDLFRNIDVWIASKLMDKDAKEKVRRVGVYHYLQNSYSFYPEDEGY